jgi:hypothetical protein
MSLNNSYAMLGFEMKAMLDFFTRGDSIAIPSRKSQDQRRDYTKMNTMIIDKNKVINEHESSVGKFID